MDLSRSDSSSSLQLRSTAGVCDTGEDGPPPSFELVTVVHELQQPILSADCQSEVIALLGTKGRLLLRDTLRDGSILTAHVRNPHRVVLDPTGTHALVCASDGEVYYYSVRNKKASGHFSLQHPKAALVVGSAHNLVAECVCWLPQNDGESSAAQGVGGGDKKPVRTSVHCLIGTNLGGLIFHLKIEFGSDGVPFKFSHELCVQVPVVSQEVAVSSVLVECIDAGWLVFVSTPSRLYRAEGEAGSVIELLQIFSSNPDLWHIREVQASGDTSARGCVVFYRPGLGMPAQSYAWNSVGGVVHGLIARPYESAVSNDEVSLFESHDPCPVTNEQILELIQMKSDMALRDAAASGNAGLKPEGGEASFGTTALPLDNVLPRNIMPIEVSLTAFHLLLVYNSRFVVLNHPAGLSWRGASSAFHSDYPHAAEVADRVCFDPFQNWKKGTKLSGVVRDVAARRTYIFSETTLWELQIEHEHRRQWRLFVDRAMNEGESVLLRARFFRAAYQLSRHNPMAKNLVQFMRGKFLLQVGAVNHATDMLASCDQFEDVYHLLVLHQNRAVIQRYVEKRYEFLTTHALDKKAIQVQLACLLALVVVHRLDTTARSEDTGPGSSEPGEVTVSQRETLDVTPFIERAVSQQREIFRQTGYTELLSRVLEEQLRPELLLRFVEKINKLHYVVAYHVSHGTYERAVRVLSTYGRNAELCDTWYEFAAILIRKCPIQFASAMRKAVGCDAYGAPCLLLDLERLIPALTPYTPAMNEDPSNTEHQVILFIEDCIKQFGCITPVVHDFYLSLVVRYDELRLEEFLDTSIYYNVEFALRQCQEAQRYWQCVGLYRRLRLYKEAIRTLLDSDPLNQPAEGSAMDRDEDVRSRGTSCGSPGDGRAESFAMTENKKGSGAAGNGVKSAALHAAKELLRSLPDDLEPLKRKKLWLMVAQHAIERHGKQAALDVLADSGDVLKLEDIIEEMSDHTVVECFKGTICKSLESFTMATSDLKEQQLETSLLSESLKSEIAQARHRFGYVSARQRCVLCNELLVQEAMPFLIYPGCQHAVHESCAIVRLKELGGLEAFLADEGIPRYFFEGVSSTLDLAHVDCVLCGEAAVLEVDIPLFTEDSSWSIT
ncbi:hypothetical protein TRVL_01005 [Trypanosoma vivax]|nr:hypothetical protein TRVL_01005 [Trypanosoma vivax]